MHDGRQVALKIQYPGVSKSIESDVNNIMRLVRISGGIPKGYDADNAGECRLSLCFQSRHTEHQTKKCMGSRQQLVPSGLRRRGNDLHATRRYYYSQPYDVDLVGPWPRARSSSPGDEVLSRAPHHCPIIHVQQQHWSPLSFI